MISVSFGVFFFFLICTVFFVVLASGILVIACTTKAAVAREAVEKEEKQEQQQDLKEKAFIEGKYYILPVISGYAIYDAIERSGEKMPPFYSDNQYHAEFLCEQLNQTRQKVSSSTFSASSAASTPTVN